jgi:DnaJ-class molecular chaperone
MTSNRHMTPLAGHYACCTCNGTGIDSDNQRCRDCDGTGIDNHPRE